MNKPGRKIVIFGCGGHSRSVADVLLPKNPKENLVFVDYNAQDYEKIYGFEVKQQYTFNDEDEAIFLAIGDNELRKEKFEAVGKKLITIISDTAHIGHCSSIGPGCFVGNFCHVGPSSFIDKNTILNTGSIIEHEVSIGAHCHIGPNATISGRCEIDELVFIGVGATVKDFIKICPNVLVGAGATVVSNIVEPGIYLGTPARRIK